MPLLMIELVIRNDNPLNKGTLFCALLIDLQLHLAELCYQIKLPSLAVAPQRGAKSDRIPEEGSTKDCDRRVSGATPKVDGTGPPRLELPRPTTISSRSAAGSSSLGRPLSSFLRADPLPVALRILLLTNPEFASMLTPMIYLMPELQANHFEDWADKEEQR